MLLSNNDYIQEIKTKFLVSQLFNHFVPFFTLQQFNFLLFTHTVKKATRTTGGSLPLKHQHIGCYYTKNH